MADFQPGAMLYTQSFASRPEGVEVPVYQTRAPTTADWNFPIGKNWVDQSGLATYQLVDVTSSIGVNSATWVNTGGGTTDLSTLTGNTGTATPVAGNILLAGTTNQITTAASGSTVTFTIPAVFIAPGSIASTTTITAGTTLTATLGNITATNGNFVSSTAGKGLQFNANTATGAAASPVVLNSRAGQVVFTSVNIAAAADLTLTMTNSSITSSSTQVIYSWSGATTGAALSMKSVTPGSGTIAFVVTNGTGATTSTSNITLNFIVVN